MGHGVFEAVQIKQEAEVNEKDGDEQSRTNQNHLLF